MLWCMKRAGQASLPDPTVINVSQLTSLIPCLHGLCELRIGANPTGQDIPIDNFVICWSLDVKDVGLRVII